MANVTIYRGTTPTIVANCKSDLDMNLITQIWFVISQQNKEKIVKYYGDCTLDEVAKTISMKCTQEETLSLKKGDAILQIRLLLQDGTALASPQCETVVYAVNKGGVITDG